MLFRCIKQVLKTLFLQYGTTLSSDQLNLIGRLTKNITFCLMEIETGLRNSFQKY